MLACVDGYKESWSPRTGGQQNVSESGAGLLEPNRQMGEEGTGHVTSIVCLLSCH